MRSFSTEDLSRACSHRLNSCGDLIVPLSQQPTSYNFTLTKEEARFKAWARSKSSSSINVSLEMRVVMRGRAFISPHHSALWSKWRLKWSNSCVNELSKLRHNSHCWWPGMVKKRLLKRCKPISFKFSISSFSSGGKCSFPRLSDWQFLIYCPLLVCLLILEFLF